MTSLRYAYVYCLHYEKPAHCAIRLDQDRVDIWLQPIRICDLSYDAMDTGLTFGTFSLPYILQLLCRINDTPQYNLLEFILELGTAAKLVLPPLSSLPSPRTLLCLPFMLQRKRKDTSVHHLMPSIRQTAGRPRSFIRSCVNSPNSETKSRDWNHQWSEFFVSELVNLSVDRELGLTDNSLENALLSRDQDPVIAEILKQFVLNLRPQTRNLG